MAKLNFGSFQRNTKPTHVHNTHLYQRIATFFLAKVHYTCGNGKRLNSHIRYTQCNSGQNGMHLS
jgi:hypothetical protein